MTFSVSEELARQQGFALANKIFDAVVKTLGIEKECMRLAEDGESTESTDKGIELFESILHSICGDER